MPSAATHLLAEVIRHAVAVWKKGDVVDFNILEPTERSDTVSTVLMVDGFSPNALREYCDSKCGVVNGKAFRIAHMGHVNAPMVLGTLGVVETGSARSGSRTGKAAFRPRSTG